MNSELRDLLGRVQRWALVIGLVALTGAIVGAFFEPKQFFFSYLFGYLFWLGLSLGCFVVAMIHQLTGGRWGYPTRRFFEAGFLALPLMLLLFIPIFIGLSDLYPWAQASEVAHSKGLQVRAAYENPTGYILRQAGFLAVWIWMAWCLRRWSLQQDQTQDAAPTRKARRLSGPGLVIVSILGTFAVVDWIMSLEKDWYSTVFAVIVLIGDILIAYAFAVLMLAFLRNREPIASAVTKTHYHHLGNLLLTFVFFWTYVSFGQLLIIYSGDLPHELEWYLHRIAGGWKGVAAVIALFHFFLPFMLLLFRAVKKHVAPLTILAGLLFVCHIVDTYWLVMPSFHQHGLAVSWLDFVAPLGLGGLWFAYFLSRLRKAALLPQHDPGLQFAFTYGQ